MKRTVDDSSLSRQEKSPRSENPHPNASSKRSKNGENTSDFDSPLKLLDLLNPPALYMNGLYHKDSPLSSPGTWRPGENNASMYTPVRNPSAQNLRSNAGAAPSIDPQKNTPSEFLATTERDLRPRTRFVNYSERAFWKDIENRVKNTEKVQAISYTLDQLLSEKKNEHSHEMMSPLSPSFLSDHSLMSPIPGEYSLSFRSPSQGDPSNDSADTIESRPNVCCFQAKKSSLIDTALCCGTPKKPFLPKLYTPNLHGAGLFDLSDDCVYDKLRWLIFTSCDVKDSAVRESRQSNRRIDPWAIIHEERSTPLLALQCILHSKQPLPFLDPPDLIHLINSFRLKKHIVDLLHDMMHDISPLIVSINVPSAVGDVISCDIGSLDRFLAIIIFYLNKNMIPGKYSLMLFIFSMFLLLDTECGSQLQNPIYTCLRLLFPLIGDEQKTRFLQMMEQCFFSSIQIAAYVVHVLKELDISVVGSLGDQWIIMRQNIVAPLTPLMSDKREERLGELTWSDDDVDNADDNDGAIGSRISSQSPKRTPVLPEMVEKHRENPTLTENDKSSLILIRDYLYGLLSAKKLLDDETNYMELYYEMSLMQDVLVFILETNVVDVHLVDELLSILKNASAIIPDVRGLKLDRSYVKNRLQLMGHILYFKHLHGHGGQRDLDIVKM